MKELTLEATLENIPQVTDFVNAQLEAADCASKALRMIDIAIDELFSNIARYAYAPQQGMATVQVEVEADQRQATIAFIDAGQPYDPLTHGDPDTNLSSKERKAGGFGIFIVKKSMDDIRYEYRDGCNVTTIVKKF